MIPLAPMLSYTEYIYSLPFHTDSSIQDAAASLKLRLIAWNQGLDVKSSVESEMHQIKPKKLFHG